VRTTCHGPEGGDLIENSVRNREKVVVVESSFTPRSIVSCFRATQECQQLLRRLEATAKDLQNKERSLDLERIEKVHLQEQLDKMELQTAALARRAGAFAMVRNRQGTLLSLGLFFAGTSSDVQPFLLHFVDRAFSNRTPRAATRSIRSMAERQRRIPSFWYVFFPPPSLPPLVRSFVGLVIISMNKQTEKFAEEIELLRRTHHGQHPPTRFHEQYDPTSTDTLDTATGAGGRAPPSSVLVMDSYGRHHQHQQQQQQGQGLDSTSGSSSAS